MKRLSWFLIAANRKYQKVLINMGLRERKMTTTRLSTTLQLKRKKGINDQYDGFDQQQNINDYPDW